jgi:hypothetical protein
MAVGALEQRLEHGGWQALGNYDRLDRREYTVARGYPLEEMVTPKSFVPGTRCLSAIPWHGWVCLLFHRARHEWHVSPWMYNGWLRDCRTCQWQKVVSVTSLAPHRGA